MVVSKFSDFIQSIERFRLKAKNTELWYRGHASLSYKLEPSIHRAGSPKTKSNIEKLERGIYEEFLRRSPLFDTHRRDKWDLLFLMQHYRAPTRLLDWTSSPLIALFFALEDGNTTDDAVVWAMDPAEWNAFALKDIGAPSSVLSTNEHIVDQYHPAFEGKSSRNEPLAIQGIINNPRINAQKGKFVIFSAEPKTGEDFTAELKIKNSDAVISKIQISAASKAQMLRDLESYGITYSTIFPDLEGLAVEIRRQFGGK